MAKLSKLQNKEHEKCLELLKKEVLTETETLFIYENYQESYNHANSNLGAFFTPFELAKMLTVDIPNNGRVIDLCGGIGMLGYIAYHYCGCDVTIVEFNPDYYEAGKKLLPQANWIHGSIVDKDLMASLGEFDLAISNPPFGNIKSGVYDKSWLSYTNSEFEYIAIEVASMIASHGSFIIPQMSCNFQMTNKQCVTWDKSKKYKKFEKDTGLVMEANCGMTTEFAQSQWHGVSPVVEICNFDFTECRKLKDLKALNWDLVKEKYPFCFPLLLALHRETGKETQSLIIEFLEQNNEITTGARITRLGKIEKRLAKAEKKRRQGTQKSLFD